MSAAQELSAHDRLQAQLLAEAHKLGRLQFANEVAKWAIDNRASLPAHLREELAQMIVKAGE